MSDELVSGLLKSVDLRFSVAVCTEVARTATLKHELLSTSSALLAQALCAGSLISSLQKEDGVVNVQIECDGPLRGLFVDSRARGALRGYVKNPLVEVRSPSDAFRWRPALGNSGFLSVLRELGGGEFYRSSVELTAFDLSGDIEEYFRSSDQIPTTMQLFAIESASQPLALVAGWLLQPLPDGDLEVFQALSGALKGGRGREVAESLVQAGSASALATALFPREDMEVLSRYPLEYRCQCSQDRVSQALLAVGQDELLDMLAKEGKAEVTCHFCGTRYTASSEDIRALIELAKKAN